MPDPAPKPDATKPDAPKPDAAKPQPQPQPEAQPIPVALAARAGDSKEVAQCCAAMGVLWQLIDEARRGELPDAAPRMVFLSKKLRQVAGVASQDVTDGAARVSTVNPNRGEVPGKRKKHTGAPEQSPKGGRAPVLGANVRRAGPRQPNK